MGFDGQAFCDRDDALIDAALDTEHPWLKGITRDALEAEMQMPLAMPKNSCGETLPFSDSSWFQTPSGKAEMRPLPEWHAPQESRAAQDLRFPLEFLSRKADNYMNSTFANLPGHQAMERRTAGVLEMHATDAAARGLVTGDSLQVWNDRGRIELVAKVGEAVAPGVVAARLDWQKLSGAGGNVNALTSQRLTDLGGGATFYSALVEVARMPQAVAAD